VTFDDYVGLFCGDIDEQGDTVTTGYASPALIVEICRRWPDTVGPRSPVEVLIRLYATRDVDDVGEICWTAIEDGFQAWVQLGRPTA
jgi:hypothetical protein